MIGSVVSIIIGFAICFGICGAAKKYVDKNCQDNEPTVWIWLDDEPEEGTRAKATDDVQLMRFALQMGAI